MFRGLLLLLALAAALCASGCLVLHAPTACDDETPCEPGLACLSDGFCGAPGPGDGGLAALVDGGDAPHVDAGALTDSGPADDGGGAAVATTTTIARGPSEVELGEPVQLTATVGTASSGTPVRDGDVRFEQSSDEGDTWAALAQVSLDDGGGATYADVPLIGGVVYRARYLGTLSHAPSASAASGATTVTIPPSLAITTTSITRSPASLTLGDDVLLLVAVRTPDAAGAPVSSATVTVQELVGDTWADVATAQLDTEGNWELSHVPTTSGALRYRALFSGDEQHAPSLSAATPAVDVISPTVTTVSVTPHVVLLGDSVTVIAEVRAPDAAGLPVGAGDVTVQRSDDGVTWSDVGTEPLAVDGKVVIEDAPAAASATLAYRAAYGGDAFFAASTSVVSDPLFVLAPTFTTMTRSPAAVTAGEPVTLLATVTTPDEAGNAATAGDVAFDATPDGGASWQQVGTAPLTSGQATLDVVPVADGVAYRARYLGDALLAPSVSAATAPTTVALPEDLVTTVVTLTDAPSTLSLGDSVTLTAAVRTSADGTPVLVGDVTVQVSLDGTLWQDVSTGAVDADGEHTATHAPSEPGVVRYRALYGGGVDGDVQYGAATSASTPAMTVTSSTVTAVSRSPSTVNAGSPVTITATVKAPDGEGAAVTTGTVTLERSSDGGAWTELLSAAVDASGQVTMTHTPTAAEQVTYRARYLGATGYAGSTSPATAPVTVLQLVTKAKTWTATWSRTYFGSGNERTDEEFRYFCIQGQFSSANGNQKCAIGFDDADVRATLSGTTVTKAELYLYWDHWASGSSGAARIGTHNSTAAQSTWGALAGKSTGRKLETFGIDEARWVTLPLAVGNELKAGTTRGIVLGPGADTSQAWYGYARGATQSSPPRLRVTYEVWE